MYISKVYLYFGKFGEEMKIMSHLNNKSRFRESWFSVILLNYKNDYSIIQFKTIRYNENKKPVLTNFTEAYIICYKNTGTLQLC